MVITEAQRVGSHLHKISFYDITAPVGYLASFRKKNHTACEPGRGFVTQILMGQGKVQVLCGCAAVRAKRHLKKIGKKYFEVEGDKWVEAEQERVKLDEDRCREEGRRLRGKNVSNPYPENTDQNLAWQEGYDEPQQEKAQSTP